MSFNYAPRLASSLRSHHPDTCTERRCVSWKTLTNLILIWIAEIKIKTLRFVYWLISFLCFVCAICAKIFTPPAIRLNIKNNQNSGIRKKGSCNMPCESISDPSMLNVTMHATAPTNRKTPSQDETRITLFIFSLLLFVMDFYKDKAMILSRACKDYRDNDFSITICLFSLCKTNANGLHSQTCPVGCGAWADVDSFESRKDSQPENAAESPPSSTRCVGWWCWGWVAELCTAHKF